MKKKKTFAQRAKEIEKTFKGRNDSISKRTKQALMQKLREEQEAVKSTMAPSNTNEAKYGDLLDPVNHLQTQGVSLSPNSLPSTSLPNPPSIPSTLEGNTATKPGASAYVGAASGALDLASTAFGKTGIDTSGGEEAPEVNVGGGIASGAVKGASAGAAFGPWGAAIGGVLGAGAGLLGGKKAKRAAAEAQKNNDLKKANDFRPSDYAYGGLTDPIKKKPTKTTTKERPVTDAEAEANSYKNSPDSMFTAEGIKMLGFTDDTVKVPYPDLNLGKYKDVNYFNPVQDASGKYTLNNTKKNPANIDLYTQQTDYIKKLNPGLEFRREGFTPLINQKAYGGKMNSYEDGGPIDFLDDRRRSGKKRFQAGLSVEDKRSPATGIRNADGELAADYFGPLGERKDKTKVGKALSKAGEFLGDNYGDILSYAPVVGELFNKINKVNTERGPRLRGKSKLERVDERRLQNELDDNAVFSGVKESSAGNLGSLMAGNLMAHLGKSKATSDAAAKTFAINASQQEKEVKMDRQADMINLNLEQDYIKRKAMDEGAFQTAKENRRKSLIDSIGNIGKEESNKKLVKEMFGYTWNGKYFVDKKGNKVSNDEVTANIKNQNKTIQKMFGGYLKK